MTGENDLLRTRRAPRAFPARVGVWVVFVAVACASLASQASAAPPYAQDLGEIDRARPGAVPPDGPGSSASARTRDDEAGAPRLARVDQELAEIDALLATAHFRTALAVAEPTRGLLAGFGEHPRLGGRRARLEMMAATAEIALGRRDRARQSMIRALRADPTLILDEREASPKVLELLREARRRTGIGGPKP
jgi:hypothetical protein